MKKLLFGLVLILGITLTGCIPEVTGEDPETVITFTEEELRELIESMLPESDPQEVEVEYDITAFQDALKDTIDGVRTGVLGIVVEYATDEGTSFASGSGVIYKKEGNKYYMVTNEHVVSDYVASRIRYEKNGLLFDIFEEDITLVGVDPTTDLAVLTFESEEDFAVVPFGDSYDLELGDFVFAIGNPLGFDYFGTVTMGVISGLARYINDGVEGGFDATLLQHDAAISPGNSGGALININGELIGINNMKIVEDDVTGIGFAIPSKTVQRIVTDLEDDGELSTPYLGISTYAQVNECGLFYGVCITIIPGFPAETGGLEDDDVIIGYLNDGETEFFEVNNFNDLREAILNSSVGETIQLRYVRNGIIYVSTPIVLTEKP